MSVNSILLIPCDPNHVPAVAAQHAAIDLFQRLSAAGIEICSRMTDQIQFVDCGENFERVLCPACGFEISTRWWAECMSEDYGDGFALRRYALPCCGAEQSLNELRYEWPQGFARFRLEAMNPDVGDVTGEQMREFEAMLGCRLQKILRHI